MRQAARIDPKRAAIAGGLGFGGILTARSRASALATVDAPSPWRHPAISTREWPVNPAIAATGSAIILIPSLSNRAPVAVGTSRSA
jgi:hypothetical protein